MRPLLIILLILFLGLQYALWLSPGGIFQFWQLKRNLAELQAQNAELAQKNAMLIADVNDLKQGKEAIEERARNDLGMIKKDETFYQIAQ